MATTSKPRTPTAKARANRTQAAAAKTGRDNRANGKRTTPPPPPRSGRGGARPGAGRKPNIPGQPGVDHRQREPIDARRPVHVTIKLDAGLPRLHGKPTLEVLRAACAAAVERHLGGPFRLRHHAVQADRVHLLCEADSRPDLASGMQGLLIRVAKALNKLWSRHGRVFADRYDDRILQSPREVREALRDVFGVGK
jgi:hypothetical protein